MAVVLLLFGRGKISELMGDVAQGIKAFKKGMSDDDGQGRAGKTEPARPSTTSRHEKRAANVKPRPRKRRAERRRLTAARSG